MSEAEKELRPKKATRKRAKTFEQRFWEKVDKNGPLPDQDNPHYAGLDQCWVWKAAKTRGGYGHCGVSKGQDGGRRAHRVSWALKHGSIPDGLNVCHKCDRRACVNPSHLFVATQTDNLKDRDAKCRGNYEHQLRALAKAQQEVESGARKNWRTSPKPHLAKLTEDQVRSIRAEYAEGQLAKTIAERYGVVTSAVYMIANRKRWKHVA